MFDDRLLNELRDIVGVEHVVTDSDITSSYRTDWTGRFRSGPVPVVRPGTADEVREVVALANRNHFHVVPQGGNTGLVGGGIPTTLNSVVVSTERLRRIGTVDALSGQISVQAGVKLKELQDALRPTEWTFGVDLGARASCTIGGMVATNAGGINVVRYGTMRRQVQGIQAVLGDATLISHMSALDKDNTGYDLEGLLTGSEGTLGIITEVVLKLRSTPTNVSTALLKLPDAESAVRVAAFLRRTVASLESLEFMLGAGVKLVQAAFGGEPPWPLEDSSALLLIEVAGDGDVEAELALACAGVDDELVAEPAVAGGPSARASLWRWREEHTAAIGTLGVPLKLDVSVPNRAIARFLSDLATLPLTTTPIVFGHLGDGNLHVNVPGAFAGPRGMARESEPDEPSNGNTDGQSAESPSDHDHDRAEAMEEQILRLVTADGGSISAEHGIGVAKVPYLSLSRSAAELHAFARLKNALDPNAVLNPGVLLPS